MWPFLTFALVPANALLALQPVRRIQRRSLKRLMMALTYFFAIVSALLLLLSLPTGSIDITDLWRFLTFALLPFLPLLSLIFSGGIRLRWARISVKAIGSLLLIPTGLFFLGMCVFESAGVRHAPPLYSPDGKHVALLWFALQGALGDDYGTVDLRRSWIPFAENVYSGLGNWGFDLRPASPEVRWLDNSRLLIRYWDDRTKGDGRGGPPLCKERAATIQVVCENTAQPRQVTK